MSISVVRLSSHNISRRLLNDSPTTSQRLLTTASICFQLLPLSGYHHCTTHPQLYHTADAGAELDVIMDEDEDERFG